MDMLTSSSTLSVGLRGEKQLTRSIFNDCKLTLAHGHKWHLFVSHHWGNQDVAATIKRT